jgi:DNA-binding beta-propeller fold protein YncE
MRLLAGAALFVPAALLGSQPASRELAGPVAGGGYLLNSGWTIRPAGRQAPLDTFPMSMALSPDGKYLLALNAGGRPPSISVLDVATASEVSRTPVPDGWLGLTFAPKSDLVYAGGGSQAVVLEFRFHNGKLERARTFFAVPEEKRTARDFIGDVAFSPDGRLLYAAALYHDSIWVINPQSGRVIERFKTGRRPYRILFHPDGKSFFVTGWADGSVYHHNTDDGKILDRVALAPHPTDMVWRVGKTTADDEQEQTSESWYAARLFVAAANTNTVQVIGVSETKELRRVESVNVSLSPRQPLGMTPSALALSPDVKRLFVACSDANAVAVVDVSGPRSRVLGFLPTGSYPTAVRSLAGGGLVVLNGKGHAGPAGSASLIDPFDEEALETYTKTVYANTPYRDNLLDDAGTGAKNPVPARSGDPSPIEHVIYIVKEGNGSLDRFGDDVTPNHHKLAREFVLFDNFYANGDACDGGHYWAAAAIAPDYVQKLCGRRRNDDGMGREPAATPPAGYLWTNAAGAGLPIRNYGWLVTNRPQASPDGTQAENVRDSVLRPVTNMKYRGFDLDYPDVERAEAFIDDLAEFEKTGAMPRLLLLRLGNDRTSGTVPGRIAPRSAVADNDRALGMIVEAVSNSSFWPKTAIFVLESGAGTGADRVDSHRSPAFVISPYARRGVVDSTVYNTASMLRTMELILGLNPMTHFDAAARPMSAAFQETPDPRPYRAERPRIPLEERNPADSNPR